MMFTSLSNSSGGWSLVEVLRDITEKRMVEENIRTYQQQLQALASRLSSTEERERRRLATALHDRIGQGLAVIKLKLQVLRNMVYSTAIEGQVDDMRVLVEQVIQNTRCLTTELSPPILYELGLDAALEWLTEEFQRLHAISCNYRTDEKIKTIDNDMRSLLFQAVRELLNNIAKHAQARTVEVSFEISDGHAQIEVVDDGKGFDMSRIERKSHSFGLFNIKERLTQVGGQFVLRSEPEHGTCVTLFAPLKTDGEGTKGG